MGQLFQFVGRPMAKVQRTAAAHFEWITPLADVPDMEFGAPVVHAAHHVQFARGEGGHIVFDLLEESPVLDECHLDGFGDACPPLALRQGLQEPQIVEDRPGRGKRAGKVFLTERIDAVFDADAAVVLRERGGRNA